MELSGVHHIGLTVSDTARAVSFYARAFGASVVLAFDLPTERVQALLRTAQPDVAGTVTWLRLPGAALELFSFTPGQPAEAVAWNRPGCTHFALQVSDIHGWHARLAGDGVPCLGPPARHGASWFFYLTDPDGTLIELIETPATPSRPPAP